MVAFLFLLLAAQHPGATPTEWRPLTGEQNVKYRWSRPTANSCLVEFSSEDRQGARTFEISAKVVTNRPQGATQANSISAIAPAPTLIRQQTADRSMQVEVPRMGRDAAEIHECYGIVQVQSQKLTSPRGRGQEEPSHKEN